MSIADFSTHQNFVSDKVRSARSRMIAAAGVVDVRVAIDAGPQAGATRVLRKAELSLGSGDNNDLIMIDPIVADTSAVIRFQRSMFGVLADVEAIGDTVQVGDRTLAPGEILEAVKLPMALQVGQNKVTLTGDGQRAEKAPKKTKSSFFSLDPILVVAVISLLILMLWSLIDAYVLNATPRPAVAINAPVVAEQAVMQPERDWLADVRAAVTTRGLSENLEVIDAGNGLLKVAGAIPSGQEAALRGLQDWYDSQQAAPSVIWDIKRNSALSQMPDIAMVRLSGEPQIVMTNGETIMLGEVIQDGWVLSALSRDGMVLTRGAEQSVIALSELMP